MPISLEEERPPGLPVVKRTALGQRYVGAIVRVEQRDRLKKDDTTGLVAPLLKPNGKPRQELVVSCLTLPGSSAPVGLGDDEHLPAPGELARLILKGASFGNWIEAKGALGRPIAVGDVVTQVTEFAQVYDASGNATGSQITDQFTLEGVPRGRSVGIYGPLLITAAPPGSEWTPKAEEAYYALAPRTSVPAEVPAGGGSFGYADDSEPPF